MAAPTLMHEAYLLLIHIYLQHMCVFWPTAVPEQVGVHFQVLDVKRPSGAAREVHTLQVFANSLANPDSFCMGSCFL